MDLGWGLVQSNTRKPPGGYERRRHGFLHCSLQRQWVDRLGHYSGEAVDGGVAFLLQRGVEYTGVVQGIPGFLFLFFSHGTALLFRCFLSRLF